MIDCVAWLVYGNGIWRSIFGWYLGENPKPRPITRRAPSWSWGAVDGKVCQRFEVADDRMERELKNVAEVTVDVIYESTIRIENVTMQIFDGEMDLRCPPLLEVSNVNPSTDYQDRFTLEIPGRERNLTVDFSPDIILPNPLPKFFCAQILRVLEQ
jgi:hypothetical protein